MHESAAAFVDATRPAARPRLLAALATRNLAMPVLAVLAGALYVVNLTVSGFANSYYALAAQAGSQSWAALFFGALDAEGFITIDKPPLATWLMGLSVRALGLSSWSILLPQALLGVATVLVLYLAVRRSFGPPAAFLAGLVVAVTPVSMLIFRYDNPDALLTFLLVTAAWALGRGLAAGRLRWAILAAGLVGAAFLTKYLQAYLVLPVFALVWLVSAPVSLRRRLAGLVASAATVVLASGWWVAIVDLLPASARPYIGGSTNNSVLDLIFGYDGLGRIFGNGAGSGLGSNIDGAIGNGAGVGGGAGGFGFGGSAGLLRLFNDQFGGQIGWLIPAAVVALAGAIVLYRRGPRTDRRVAGYALWGGWLLVHAAVFSFMSGIVHPYYSVAIAPAIAALAGAGAVELWSHRERLLARVALAATTVGTGVVAWLLLERTPDFAPGLGIAVLALAVAAGLLLCLPSREAIGRMRMAPVAAVLALAAILAGPLAYATATMGTALSGGDPAAGPQVAGNIGPGGRPGDDGGGAPGTPGGRPGDGFQGVGRPGGFGGDAGQATDTRLVAYLLANRGDARWIVAVSGSNGAAAIQLAAGEPVMAMGGFTGSDPTPTLNQLKAYVAGGELRFVLVNGGGPVRGGGFDGAFGGLDANTTWVTASCTQVTVDGSMATGLYDCAVAP